jgi:hypothetical protein
MISGRIIVPEHDCLVSLRIEFNTDDFWFFFLKDAKKGCRKIEDMSGANKGNHVIAANTMGFD